MVLALMAIVYALAHHLRLSGGSLGAAYAKWGMRRHTIGSKKPGGRGRTLPSNSILTFIALIFVVSCAFCVIGADYVNPSSSVLDFSTSFRRKRASSSPSYTIQKSYWTSGSRFGFIAFALTPLVVLFALKSPPFAVLSLKMLSELHADKLMTFHRASAWLVWLFTTVHVVLWTLQLFYDSYNGRAVWFYLWGNYRFLFGCVAYGCMCGVMVLSLRPIRKHGYEVSFDLFCLGCAPGIAEITDSEGSFRLYRIPPRVPPLICILSVVHDDEHFISDAVRFPSNCSS